MRSKVRFTFVCDRFNRTATASLLASLEGNIAGFDHAMRLVDRQQALDIEFDTSTKRLEVLCMSSMSENFSDAAELVSRIRRRLAKTGLVSICGGPHATGDPAGALKAGFDFCCVGEGEATILEIARSAVAGEGLDDTDGVFRLDGTALRGRPRPGYINLDEYWPLPRSMKFPGYIEIGRGCRWHCSYCQTPAIFGSKERFRSPDKVEALVSAYAGFGMRHFRLLLPNALGYNALRPRIPDCDALEEVLGRVRSASRGGKIYLGSFPSEVRPDYVTEEAIRVLRKHVSNRRLVIGGQSGSQRILDMIGRGHRVEDIRCASRIVASEGFTPAVDIMLGLPEEESDDRAVTFGLIEELGRDGARVNMHFFMPLPGTPLAGGEPAFLTAGERRLIDRLAQKGIVRGRWRRQEELAREWFIRRRDRSLRQ